MARRKTVVAMSGLLTMLLSLQILLLSNHHALRRRTDPQDNFKHKESCLCVECSDDEVCGGLWKGEAFSGWDDFHHGHIHLVISHCLHPLHWLSNFTAGYRVSNVTIISKCGKEIVGAPQGAAIVRLPNVGREGHSYAYFLTRYSLKVSSDYRKKEILVFLKDDRREQSNHQTGSWRPLQDMLRTASKTGFACGSRPGNSKQSSSSLSVFHDTTVLKHFRLRRYSSSNGGRSPGKYKSIVSDEVPFASGYSNLGEWWSKLGISPDELTQVCYGGTFAVSSLQILNSGYKDVFDKMRKSLARGDNIEEGHFAERTWGALLSSPLTQTQKIGLLNHKQSLMKVQASIFGALAH